MTCILSSKTHCLEYFVLTLDKLSTRLSYSETSNLSQIIVKYLEKLLDQHNILIHLAVYIDYNVWPVISKLVDAWVANRIIELAISRQGQVKTITIAVSLSIICLGHINLKYSFAFFNTFAIKPCLQDAKRFFFLQKLFDY